MNELKQKLLDLNLVVDNEYLDKYVELIEANRSTKREKFKTQKHHIIPRSYYKHENVELDNTSFNVVNLTHVNHILAHYFLSNCACVGYFAYSNEYAVLFMTDKGRLDNRISYDALLNEAPRLQEVYEDFRIRQSELVKLQEHLCGRKVSDATRKKLSDSHKGIKQSDETRKKRSESLKRCYQNGAKVVKCNEEQKKLYKELYTGKIAINKDNIMKYIKEDELLLYQSLGWSRGISQKLHDSNRSNPILQKGRKFSEETRRKMSEKKIGCVPYNKGKSCAEYKIMSNGIINKHVYNDKQEKEFLQQGFTYGTVKQNKEKHL